MKEIVKAYEQRDVREKIEKNIQENRKGKFCIQIKTSDNKPVKSSVKAIQKNNRFRFGANCFMIDELESEEKNEIYKTKFSKVFNMATLPFYWDATEPERGMLRFDANSPKLYRRPPIDLCLDFCAKNRIEPKGHCLNYEPWVPEWAKKLGQEEYKSALEERMRVIGERYSGRIKDFEVMNEILQKKSFETPLRKDVEWSFKTARKYFPSNRLFINEGPNVFDENISGENRYFDLIKRNLEKGVPIDGIGIQGHFMWMDKISLDPYNQWSTFDLYSSLSLPFSITEVTLPGAIDGKVDEGLQAELLRCLYSLWFGIKDMGSVIYWNLIDGYAYGSAPGDMSAGENIYYGGLIGFDGTEKQAYKVLDELVNREWKTRSEGKTDSEGEYSFEGFFGTYEISYETENKKGVIELELSPDKKLYEIEV